jgi:DNA mismatch repair ATPase MutL
MRPTNASFSNNSKASPSARRPAAQRLLLPETIDLGFREAQILERLAPELDRYGLEIEPFGGNTFVVKAMPTLLDSGDIPALVTQLVEKTAEIGVGAEMETVLDECLMLMACHNAIRAHQQLSETQIKAMLEQLDACDNPSHCPHGRPIWIRWTHQRSGKAVPADRLISRFSSIGLTICARSSAPMKTINNRLRVGQRNRERQNKLR